MRSVFTWKFCFFLVVALVFALFLPFSGVGEAMPEIDCILS